MSKEFLLDNNIYKYIAGTAGEDQEISLEKMKDSGHEFFTTHVEKDEFEEADEDTRNELFQVVQEIESEELPTESFRLGTSRLGKAKLSDGEKQKDVRKRLGGGSNEDKDALIIETAIQNDLILVSEESSHEEAMNQMNEQFMNKDEFKEEITNA